jgi:hypothetical protein
MIRDYVLLPHMLTMVQKYMEEMQNSSNLLKRLYLSATQVVMNQINRDMYELRRELSRRRIRVVGDEQVDLVVYHRFICRGYEDRLGIVREVMRAEISVRLTRYLGEVSRWLGEFGRPAAEKEEGIPVEGRR